MMNLCRWGLSSQFGGWSCPMQCFHDSFLWEAGSKPLRDDDHQTDIKIKLNCSPDTYMVTTAYIHTFVVIDQHPSCWVQELWEREIWERSTPIMLDSKNLRDTNTDRHREFLGTAQCKSSYELVCLLCLLIAESARGNVDNLYLLGKWKESDSQSEKKWNPCGEKMVAGGGGGGSSCMYTYLRRWTAQRSSFWTARLRRGATDMPSRPVVADMPKQTLETFRKPPCASSWAFSRACLLACLLRFFQRNSIAISSAKESPHRIIQNQQRVFKIVYLLSLSLSLSSNYSLVQNTKQKHHHLSKNKCPLIFHFSSKSMDTKVQSTT